MGNSLSFLGAWAFDPALAISLGLVVALYAWAAHSVTRRNPMTPWPALKSMSFLSGIALLWVVLQGPTGVFDDTFFWAHMVQHIVLVMVCAPLLLLGAPVLLTLRASSPEVRRRWLVPLLRSRLADALTNPVVTWLALVLVIVGTHFTPFYELALENPLVHRYVEHPLYLGAALLYFYPLLPGSLATRRVSPAGRVLSLFLMMVPETMTGFFIYASPTVMYPFYALVDRPFGPAALADQQLGGALMWSGSMLIDAGWVTLAALAWLRSEEARGRRLNTVIAREIGARPHA
ncbi:MAG: cytochrome c oxidase assembly protein [Dermatophilaceae bacterium]